MKPTMLPLSRAIFVWTVSMGFLLVCLWLSVFSAVLAFSTVYFTVGLLPQSTGLWVGNIPRILVFLFIASLGETDRACLL